jgi:pimeloyl-ACP methyl ester carboxylesterase
MPQRGAYGVGLDTCCMVEVDPERFEVMVSEALDGIPGDLGTGSEFVFGLSSGALVCLDAALSLPQIRQLALYEPPLSVDHSTPVDWLARFDREIAEGKIGSAMITATRGTRTAPALIRWTPRSLLAPLLDMAARRSDAQPGGDGTPESLPMSPRRPVLWVLLWPVRRFAASRTTPGPGEDGTAVPLSDLVPTMHFDAQLVLQSEGRLPDYQAIAVPVLLLRGSDSPKYLQRTLDAPRGHPSPRASSRTPQNRASRARQHR